MVLCVSHGWPQDGISFTVMASCSCQWYVWLPFCKKTMDTLNYMKTLVAVIFSGRGWVRLICRGLGKGPGGCRSLNRALVSEQGVTVTRI